MGQKKRRHDVLAVQDNNYFYLIDPTIWQFFKTKRKILIGITKNFNDAFNKIQKIYKGKWKVSEELKPKDCKEEKEWIKMIDLNTKI